MVNVSAAGGGPTHEPFESLCGGILLRELLVAAWLPNELHPVELNRRPELAVLRRLGGVSGGVMAGSGHQGLQLALRIVAAAARTHRRD